jgi:hypothetical protein
MHVPPLQVLPSAQRPQFTVVPQLVTSLPQFMPAHAVPSGVQPQMLGEPPPPQVWPVPVQVAAPQGSVVPQLVVTVPQLAPLGQVVVAVQPQTLGVPPPPQVTPVPEHVLGAHV